MSSFSAFRSFILFIFVFIALGVPLKAQEISLEEQILAGDVDAVEQRLTNLHAQHLAGEIHADDVRVEFTKFGQTNPALPVFIEDWINTYPASPYAQAAAGWNMNQAAWRMRGDGPYRYVWPEALAAFNEMMQKSQDHGIQSYNAAPDLVAASDLLLANEPVLDALGANFILNLIDDVMTATPNRGTLYRAAWVFSPQWGGNIGRIETLCDRYFDVVTSVNYDSELVCIADMVMSVNPNEDLRDRAIEILSSVGWKGFEGYQYNLYRSPNTRRISQLTEDDVAEYLQQDGIIHNAMARSFYDSQFYYWAHDREQPDALKVTATQIILRAKEMARAALIWDPGNVDLVETILHRTETAIDSAALQDLDLNLALWGEVLHVAPFDPKYWHNAAESMYRRSMEDLSRTWPYVINTIAYSNHNPFYVDQVFSNRAMSYNWAHSRLESGELDPALQNLVNDVLLCPTIRLSRIHNVLCEAEPSIHECTTVFQHRDNILERAIETAKEGGFCTTEFNAPISDLVFYPVSVDVGGYSHVANPAYQ